MDIVTLQNFLMLAQTQHMTRAAAALSVAQSALSRSLRNLEAELGVELFDRIGKYIYLNENGQVFLKHAEIMMREYTNARLELDERRGAAQRTVTLSMYAGSKLLPELIRGFKDAHPGITLRIMQQAGAEEKPALGDITVYSSMQAPGEADAVVLMEEEICLAVPAEHPLAKRRAIRLEEAAGEPFICLYKGKGLRAITDELCRQAGFEPSIVLESDSPGTVRELVSVGVGLTFVPQISWRGMGDDPNVVLVDIQQPRCARFVIMRCPKERYLTEAAAALRAYLIEFFEGKAGGVST